MEPISRREHEVNQLLPHKERPLPRRKSQVVRFLDHVLIQPGDCWLWTGHINHGGYGYYRHPQASHAHTAAYVLFRGPIPDGHQVDHICRVRHCVNPDHLEAVTASVNMRRRPWKGCDRLHPLEPSRVGQRSDGRVQCRECQRVREQARRDRWKAA